LRKLKKGGVTGIFVMEKEMISSQLLSVVESLFDGIIEFQIREEGDELVSYYRIRTFKLKEFDTNWREFK
jgi:KaiC/GvpD/RAD55 family RecA-like ATPase